MPPSDDANFKLSLLEKQLGNISLFRNSCDAEHKKKDLSSDSNIITCDKNGKFVTAENSCQLLINMIDNNEIFEGTTEICLNEKHAKEKALSSGKKDIYNVEKLLAEIFKNGPQVYKDVMNYLKKRFDLKNSPNQEFNLNEVIGSLKCSHCEGLSDISYMKEKTTKEADDMTFLKQTYDSQGEVAVVNDSLAGDNLMIAEHEDIDYDITPDAEPEDINCISQDTSFLVHVQGIKKLNTVEEKANAEMSLYLQLNKDQEVIETDMLKCSVSMKYVTDILETEKQDKAEKGEDVEYAFLQEKQDIEKTEKSVSNLAVAEIQDFFNMEDYEILSDSFEFLPQTMSLSFMLTPDYLYIDRYPSMNYISLESIQFSAENRLSFEPPFVRNLCYQGNIIASRQTNLPSICCSLYSQSDSDILSERIMNHAEGKACNLIKIFDTLNFGNISFGKKYDSKDLFVTMDDSYEDSSDLGYEYSDEKQFPGFLADEEIKCISDIHSSHEGEYEKCFGEIQESNGLKNTLKEEFNAEFDKMEAPWRRINNDAQEKEMGKQFDSMEYESNSFIQNKIEEKEVEATGSESGYCFENSHEEVKKTFATAYFEDRITTRKIDAEDIEDNSSSVGHGNMQEEVSCMREMLILTTSYCNRDSQSENNEGCSSKKDREQQDTHAEILKIVWDRDRKKNMSNHCQRVNWKNGHVKKLFPKTSNRKNSRNNQNKPRKIQNRPRKDIAVLMKRFQQKLVKNVILYNKIDASRRKEDKQLKQRNYVKFKSSKLAGKAEFYRRQMQFFQRQLVSTQRHTSEQNRNSKGYDSDLIKESKIKLHSVEAKFHSCSGGEGGQGRSGSSGNSDRGSSDRGDGRNSGRESGRGNGGQNGRGNGGQNSNGNSSSSGGGDDGRNNNNNNENNKKLNLEKQVKKLLVKKDDNKDGTCVKKSNLDQAQSPSSSSETPPLPHISSSEHERQQFRTRHRAASPPGSGFHESGIGFSEEQNFRADVAESPSIQHAAMSIEQLCDVVGDATSGIPLESAIFTNMNLCLTHLIHDLTLAANDDTKEALLGGCNVCLILSQLLIHMANPGHDGFQKSCQQCAQIFNLMMQHCIGCIENGRRQSRFTQSDLCYKICKSSLWKVDRLYSNVNRLKSKVQKYCDKVLGSIADVPVNYSDDGVIGEVGAAFSDAHSTGLSSSTTLSLNGNIITTESCEQEHLPSGNIATPSVKPPGPSAVVSSAAVPSVNVAAGSVGTDSVGHMRLTRKPSQSRKTPAIPPPIVEEHQPLEPDAPASIPAGAEGRNKDDIETIIYKRFASDESQKAYGANDQYGSVPLHNVHDGAQFYSVSTRPLGVPGIGEVVYGHLSQLRIVARFWDKKREECEKTQTCRYQHREEGVILADQEENFSILRTRYQKHHQWERVSHLGNGMSGKCHLAIDLKTNFKFCCKKIHLLRYAEEELSLWSELRNPYIVRLYGAIRHGVKIYIFSEFIDGGSLAACIEEQKCLGRRLSHWSAINYFQQLLKVLAFLQSKNILHEDIKASLQMVLLRSIWYCRC